MKSQRRTGLSAGLAALLLGGGLGAAWWATRGKPESVDALTIDAEPASAPTPRARLELTGASPVREVPRTGDEARHAERALGAPIRPQEPNALDEAAATFLTEQPDLQALDAACLELASAMQVDTESLLRRGTTLRGKLTVPGTDLEGDFVINDGFYRVKFTASGKERFDAPFTRRDVVLQMWDEASGTRDSHSSVQFHPDTSMNAADYLDAGEERVVGWNLRIGSLGTHAIPITVLRDPEGQGWRIGHAAKLTPRDFPSVPGTQTHATLIDKLRRL